MTCDERSFSARPFYRSAPPGGTYERDICRTFGFLHHANPKVVTGSIVRHDGLMLLRRRAIEPGRGFWTLPAGFMELGETVGPAAGARHTKRPTPGSSSTGSSPS